MTDQVGRIEFGPPTNFWTGTATHPKLQGEATSEVTVTILPEDYLQQQSEKLNEYKRRAKDLLKGYEGSFALHAALHLVRDLAGEP